MNAYQSFSKPIKGQKVWVLASKTNLNEFWWFPYFETTDFTQSFLDAHYDHHPDVLHSREHSSSMISYDDFQGYMMQCGKTYVNVQQESVDIKANSCHVKISGDHVTLGKGTDSASYDKATNSKLMKEYLNKLGDLFQQLNETAKTDSHTALLCPAIEAIENKLSGVTDDQISFKNVSGN
jgi:Mg2+ and Co2+ transporter CorA